MRCIQFCAANEEDQPQLCCGPYQYGWRDVGLIARWMRWGGYASHSEDFRKAVAAWLANMRDMCEEGTTAAPKGSQKTLLLYRTSRFQASVTHDKLYAPFGLASDFWNGEGDWLLEPNYKNPRSRSPVRIGSHCYSEGLKC
jgi:hypothetical protein